METHETCVSLETAKLLKKAGFDWATWYFFEKGHRKKGWNYNVKEIDKFTSCPTLSVAQKWLREVKGINIQIQSFFDSINSQYNVIVGYDYFIHRINGKMTILPNGTHYQSYEEAQEAGIKKALELILEKGE